MICCPSCGKWNNEETGFCSSCGVMNIVCPKCNSLVAIDDEFCGNCGQNLSEIIKYAKSMEKEKKKEESLKKEELLAKKKQQDFEKEMNEYADNLIVDCEGNKFKAIKEFKNKYQVDNDIASKYINVAYDKINADTNENKDNLSENDPNSIEEIVKRNNYDSINSIREVKEIYGYGLAEAKELVDKAISDNSNKVTNSSNEVANPNGIKKTIIVSQSSRKKATSAIGRGLIGGAILGPVGLLAGASAKSKETTTFQVIYNNGKQDTITVKNNSWAFKEYCKYLDN